MKTVHIWYKMRGIHGGLHQFWGHRGLWYHVCCIFHKMDFANIKCSWPDPVRIEDLGKERVSAGHDVVDGSTE